MKLRLLICLTASSLLAPAQSITSAILTGEVQDATGAPVPSVGVDVRNADRDQHWRAASDAEGRFRFSALPPGRNELGANDARFTRAPMSFVLHVGQTADIRVELTVTGGSQS